MTSANRIGAIGLAALTAMLSPLAVAQTQPAPMSQEISEAEIAAFAEAYEDVVEINATFAPQIEQATDAEARQDLLEQAQQAQTLAVETTDGIDVDRYFEILTLAQSDADLTARITALLEG